MLTVPQWARMPRLVTPTPWDAAADGVVYNIDCFENIRNKLPKKGKRLSMIVSPPHVRLLSARLFPMGETPNCYNFFTADTRAFATS